MNDTRITRPRALRALALLLIVPSLVLAFLAGCGGGGAPAGTATNESSADATTTPPAEDTAAAAPAATATPAELGAKVFATRCALCHGANGHGDGVASKGLNPKPRNFHDRAYMSTRTDAQLLEVIHQGKGAMPKWAGLLSEAEITAVLAHIRGLGTQP
jgi:mono/diheme cytochrome c family protein